MIKIIFIITSLFLFLSFKGFSADLPKIDKIKKIMISGKISDIQSNETLAGVKIECKNNNKSFYSDLNGRFFIYIETSDETPILEISQIGYSSKTIDLNAFQGNKSNLEIDLKSE